MKKQLQAGTFYQRKYTIANLYHSLKISVFDVNRLCKCERLEEDS